MGGSIKQRLPTPLDCSGGDVCKIPKLNGNSKSAAMSARQFLVGVMSPKVRRILFIGETRSYAKGRRLVGEPLLLAIMVAAVEARVAVEQRPSRAECCGEFSTPLAAMGGYISC